MNIEFSTHLTISKIFDFDKLLDGTENVLPKETTSGGIFLSLRFLK